MKTFNITFVEEVTSQVKIEAETLEKAEQIIERDHFQITESYEESEVA